MAKIHQNAQSSKRDPQSGWSERQKAAGYAYGANAVKPETLGRFPLGPGGVAPNPNVPLPDYPGMWGAGRKKSGGGGGGGGGDKKKKKTPTPTPRPTETLIPPITKENTQGAMTPPITPENTATTVFPPDLAPSPNPYQPGSPVDPRMSAQSNIGPFQGPPMPTGIDALPPDLAPSPNPYQTGSPVNPNANPNPFGTFDPKDILAAIIAAGGDKTGSIGGGAGGPVVQPGAASGTSPILGGQRPVIDIRKLMGG